MKKLHEKTIDDFRTFNFQSQVDGDAVCAVSKDDLRQWAIAIVKENNRLADKYYTITGFTKKEEKFDEEMDDVKEFLIKRFELTEDDIHD